MSLAVGTAGGAVPVPAWGIWGRAGLVPGGGAWQHLTANQTARMQSPPMDGEEELIGRPWVGPGSPDAPPGYKRQGSHFMGEHTVV